MTRLRMLFTVLLLFAAAVPADAASLQPFTPGVFQKAQQAGKPIVLDVWASWCPTCKQQEPTLSQILADPEFADLVFLRIDFDKDKALLRKLKVQQQSTLITYRGAKEIGRSTGETDPGALRNFVAKAIEPPPS